ncbi:hypothetical protein BJ508DRAFT_339975 [Ascobolus immersus RN42]|uniref:Uncharacterized protein n=1 Tax=Ascobolus immersus RN42 TaxID=1160509 RepID=A0A3N4ISN0_ASCIM|nr:hypothetical protein BJ508DRAFT_339975 [Ascobolus immersus RN42]
MYKHLHDGNPILPTLSFPKLDKYSPNIPIPLKATILNCTHHPYLHQLTMSHEASFKRKFRALRGVRSESESSSSPSDFCIANSDSRTNPLVLRPGMAFHGKVILPYELSRNLAGQEIWIKFAGYLREYTEKPPIHFLSVEQILFDGSKGPGLLDQMKISDAVELPFMLQFPFLNLPPSCEATFESETNEDNLAEPVEAVYYELRAGLRIPATDSGSSKIPLKVERNAETPPFPLKFSPFGFGRSLSVAETISGSTRIQVHHKGNLVLKLLTPLRDAFAPGERIKLTYTFVTHELKGINDKAIEVEDIKLELISRVKLWRSNRSPWNVLKEKPREPKLLSKSVINGSRKSGVRIEASRQKLVASAQKRDAITPLKAREVRFAAVPSFNSVLSDLSSIDSKDTDLSDEVATDSTNVSTRGFDINMGRVIEAEIFPDSSAQPNETPARISTDASEGKGRALTRALVEDRKREPEDFEFNEQTCLQRYQLTCEKVEVEEESQVDTKDRRTQKPFGGTLSAILPSLNDIQSPTIEQVHFTRDPDHYKLATDHYLELTIKVKGLNQSVFTSDELSINIRDKDMSSAANCTRTVISRFLKLVKQNQKDKTREAEMRQDMTRENQRERSNEYPTLAEWEWGHPYFILPKDSDQMFEELSDVSRDRNLYGKPVVALKVVDKTGNIVVPSQEATSTV